MARRRDYGAEARRRNELARQRGFRNYWAQRTAPRYPETGLRLGRLPEEARAGRSDAISVLDEAARRRVPIEQVADERGISRSVVRYFADRGTEHRGGIWRAKAQDGLLRLRPMVIEGEVRFVEAHGRRSARTAERVFDTQWRYAHGRATQDELATLPKTYQGLPVTRDPGELVDVALRGIPQEVIDAYRDALGGQS